MDRIFTSRNCIAFLGILVLACYYPSLFAPLNTVDDFGTYNYLLNADSFSFRSIFFPGGSGSYYRPILLLSFMTDKYFWGLEESFMHLENILFHLANSLLLFAVARRACLVRKQTSFLVPFSAALFFAIHPLNTEAVNWISGRTDLLAGFFLLLSIYLLLKQPLAWTRSSLAAICLLLACLAKETAIFFLPAALFFPFFLSGDCSEAVPLGTTWRRNLPHFLLFGGAGFGYFVFRGLAFSRGDQGINRVVTHLAGSESSGVLLSLRLVFKAMGFYAKKLLFPFPLNFGITTISDLYLPLGVLVLAGICWLLFRRTLPAFFVVCAGAVGGSALIIPLIRLTWTPLGERYMYIPSAFFLVGLTMAVADWERRHTRYGSSLVLVVCSLAGIALYGTVSRNFIWQSNLALFQDTYKKSPDFAPARNEIANALYALGKKQEAAVIYKSFVGSQELINVQYGLKNKALALAQEGDFAGSRHILQELLANPGKHEVSILLQLLELEKVQVAAHQANLQDVHAESVTTLTRLIKLTEDPFYSYRLGIVHMQSGETEQALAAFSAVVRNAPPAAYYRKPAETLAHKLANELAHKLADKSGPPRT